jgi:hypothetical protein
VAHPFGVAWPNLKQLIDLFVAMGCELGDLPGTLSEPDGTTHKIRFLYSPTTDDFVSLSDYEDDEYIPPSEVANWERRLGMEIPKTSRDWN